MSEESQEAQCIPIGDAVAALVKKLIMCARERGAITDDDAERLIAALELRDA